MPLPRSLRVFGSRPLLQNFLPPHGALFDTVEFVLVPAEQVEASFGTLPNDAGLQIVVNPDEFAPELISSLEGIVWLWFLGRLDWDSSSVVDAAPRLTRRAEELIQERRAFLDSLAMGRPPLVVASDEDSRVYASRQGFQTLLSPPPVVDGLLGEARSPASKARFIAHPPATEYAEVLMKSVEPFIAPDTTSAHDWPEELRRSTHAVTSGESIARTLPYEAAIALASGLTLISEPLAPLWGLEPGIDYFEYSTPEELERICEHIVRYPQSTQLMASRGRVKAQAFRASTVWDRLARLTEELHR